MNEVEEANERTERYASDFIAKCFQHACGSSCLEIPEHVAFAKKSGKVRDIYVTDDLVIVVATDRQSAFDRNLALVPFKV